MKRVLELDGIRGVAIAMVLVFHYFVQPTQFLPGSVLSYLKAACRLTWSGVDLFFVLSGFLIGGILLDSRDHPDYFRNFYTRRFFRIVPIYGAMLVLTHPLMGWLGVHQVGRWWVYPLFLQNFSMAAANDFGLWGMTWSLAVEEQFYLTLPAIVRYVRGVLPWVIGAGIVAAPVIRVVLFYVWPTKVFYAILMPCRADTLLLGVVAAMWMRSASAAEWLRHQKNYLWAAGGVLLIGAGVITLHARWMLGIEMASFGYTWLALLYTAVLLLAVTQPQSWLGAVLRFGPLRFLGRIAYGVYLLHPLFLVVLKTGIHTWPYAALAALAFIATLVLSVLSWRYFEKPLIDFGHRRTAPQ